MRQFKGIDVSPYGRAFAMLVKYPQVMLGPLVAGVVRFILLGAMPVAGGADLFGGLSAGIYQLLGQFVSSVGLAFALIAADAAWRGRRVSVAQTWDDAQRRIGDIFFAMIGFSFVVYVAGLVGGVLGGFGSLALTFVAFFFFVYTLAAATIGGVPGSAALQASLERARDNPAPTLLLTALFIFINAFAVDLIVGPIVGALMPDGSPLVGLAVRGLASGLLNGYFAFVLAKVYADLAFGRRRW